MMRKGYLLAILIIGLGFSGCKKKTESHSSRYLNLCLDCPVKSLDPHIGTANPSVHIIKMLHEGLMVRTGNGELENGLAESYTLSEDKKLILST